MRIAVLFLLMSASCAGCVWSSKQAQAERVVEKIEAFKARESRLPRSIKEVGEKEDESGPVYYRQVSESKYEVWYGASLGESVTYDSERKVWK